MTGAFVVFETIQNNMLFLINTTEEKGTCVGTMESMAVMSK